MPERYRVGVPAVGTWDLEAPPSYLLPSVGSKEPSSSGLHRGGTLGSVDVACPRFSVPAGGLYRSWEPRQPGAEGGLGDPWHGLATTEPWEGGRDTAEARSLNQAQPAAPPAADRLLPREPPSQPAPQSLSPVLQGAAALHVPRVPSLPQGPLHYGPASRPSPRQGRLLPRRLSYPCLSDPKPTSPPDQAAFIVIAKTCPSHFSSIATPPAL